MKPAREPFDASLRALRDMTASRDGGEVTRIRVLGLLAGRKQRRRKTYAVALVSAVLLVAVPAVSAGWKYLKSRPEHPNARTSHQIGSGPLPSRVRPSAMEAPSVAISPAAMTPFGAPALDENQPPRAPASPKAAAPPTLLAPTARVVVKASELELYGRAHEAHFHARNYGKALRLWVDYIVRFPGGRFRPEAQFNRAVCLVRLGDETAARKVLIDLLDRSGPEHPRDQAKQLLAQLR